MPTEKTELQGSRGRIVVHSWPNDDPRYVALIAHGYAEHARRYDHVADALVDDGAVVYAPDHHGHGESDGEKGVVDDVEGMVEDLRSVAERAGSEQPGLPLVLVGHSMGGVIASRFAQRPDHGLSALVLTGPVVGGNPDLAGLLDLPEMPEVPVDPDLLSRDPEVGRRYMEDPLVYSGPFQRVTIQTVVDATHAVAGGGSFDVPTLWMHGEEDGLAPLAVTRPAVERIGGQELQSIVFSGARHEIFNETNKDEVIERMLGFLDQALSRAGCQRADGGARETCAGPRGAGPGAHHSPPGRTSPLS